MQDELTYMYGKRHEKNYRLCPAFKRSLCVLAHSCAAHRLPALCSCKADL